MSFCLSAYAVWADKGDLAHYTSMSRSHQTVEKKQNISPTGQISVPKRLRVVLAHARLCRLTQFPLPQGGVLASLIRPWLPV